ncbi:MAG TPA: hypothetical protein VIV60_11260 [Polyangiaceae bacterium]
MSVPSWLYRWSIKGTTLLLAPLLWLAHDVEKQGPRQIAESLFVQRVHQLSWGIVLLAAGRAPDLLLGIHFGLLAPYTQFVTMKDAHGIMPAFFPTNSVPWWQRLLAACAFVNVCAVHYADRLRNKTRAHTRTEKAVLDSAVIVVGILAAATIFAMLTLSMSLIRLNGPSIGR